MDTFLLAATEDGLVVYRRQAEAWEQISRTLSERRVESVSAHGRIIVAGTTEGVFRSEDLGQSWSISSAGLGHPHLRWLAHHPDFSGVVLAGTEPAAIYLSWDDGQNWEERPEVAELRDEHGWYLPYSPEAGCVRGFAFHGQRAYAAVEQGGLLRSDDGGVSWQLAEGSNGEPRTPPEGFVHPDVHSVAVHPRSPDLVLAPTGGGFYRSEDGGAKWTRLYPSYCRAVWADPADPARLILGPADSVDRNGQVKLSEDGGQSWRDASQGLDTPWPRTMVNRFVQVDYELLAVLSNGDLLSAPLEGLEWRRILPEAGRILAVTSIQA
jgi:photosystem II stability/assembly factor-like uncharacterized protein